MVMLITREVPGLTGDSNCQAQARAQTHRHCLKQHAVSRVPLLPEFTAGYARRSDIGSQSDFRNETA
ncbi:hypothetical protein DR64_7475 [Paraburkholderia xenovorans LB400]|nr:hypothetical protein DR64_7475 [Paraburkholderia xenovorans LB400]